MPQHDFVQHSHPAATDLRHHRAHRVDVEIERPQQRQVRIDRQTSHMVSAIEGVIHQSPAHEQVLPEHFLLIELLVVAAFQALVIIRHLSQQIFVFVRPGLNHFVPGLGVRNEPPVHPVIALWRPHSEAAQARGFRVAQPTFEPQPGALGRVGQLIQPEPGQVSSPQPLEFVHGPEQNPRSAVLQLQGVLSFGVLVRNPVALEDLEHGTLRCIPQHGISRRPDQPGPAAILVGQLDRLLAKRLALPRTDRPGKAFHARQRVVKCQLGRQHAVYYRSVDVCLDSIHEALISFGSSWPICFCSSSSRMNSATVTFTIGPFLSSDFSNFLAKAWIAMSTNSALLSRTVVEFFSSPPSTVVSPSLSFVLVIGLPEKKKPSEKSEGSLQIRRKVSFWL